MIESAKSNPNKTLHKSQNPELTIRKPTRKPKTAVLVPPFREYLKPLKACSLHEREPWKQRLCQYWFPLDTNPEI